MWKAVVILVGVCAVARADVFEPYSNRIISPRAEGYFAVVRLLDGERGLGPVVVQIKRQTRTLPRVGPQLVVTPNRLVSVHASLPTILVSSLNEQVARSSVVGGIELPSAPERVLLSARRDCVIAVGAFGPRTKLLATEPIVTIASLKGTIRHRVFLHQMFSDAETSRWIRVFPLNGVWIDERSGNLVLVVKHAMYESKKYIVTISIADGEIQRAGTECISEAVKAENANSIVDILDMAISLGVEVPSDDLERIRMDHQMPVVARMMAEVLLAKTGVGRGRQIVDEALADLRRILRESELEHQLENLAEIGTQLGYDKRIDQALTVKTLVLHMPNLVRENALEDLFRIVERGDSYLSRLACRSMASYQDAAIELGISKLQQEVAAKSRIAAARLLNTIGPPARDALPVLRHVAATNAGDLATESLQAIAHINRKTIEHDAEKPRLEGFKNSIGMEFRRIPSGSFEMGGSESPASLGRSIPQELVVDERPPHRVSISRAYFISTTEVTQLQFRQVMGVNPSESEGDFLPVDSVTWFEAVEFCKKLSANENRQYQLPTEAEWEYACRAGMDTRWSCDDDGEDLDEYAWLRPGAQMTHPVAQKKPNLWGLFDVHGNVAEWCMDWAAEYASDSVVDPNGPPNGVSRIARGGHAASLVAIGCRSACRLQFGPHSRNPILGFRVVLVAK